MSSNYLTEPAALAALCAEARARGVMALDVEFIREHTYKPVLALVQIAVGDTLALIDPLRFPALEILDEIILDPQVCKVLHAGGQDLEIFFNRTTSPPRRIFDCQIAAALMGLGYQLSLSSVVERLLGVVLDKSETYTDWLRRPLSAKQEEYALNDVRYLLPVYERLANELVTRDRVGWAAEEFARLEQLDGYVADPRQLYRRVKRFSLLSPRGQAVLRELAIWREQEAVRRDRPRRHVLSDEALMEIATRQPSSREELARDQLVHPRELAKCAEALLEAVHAGLAAPESDQPRLDGRGRMSSAERSLAKGTYAHLRAECERREICPEIVATSSEVESIVRRFVDGERSAPITKFSGWRLEFFEPTLLAYLESRDGPQLIAAPESPRPPPPLT
ncbi:MAG: ribonuclease D [Planctomycetota bacterium]